MSKINQSLLDLLSKQTDLEDLEVSYDEGSSWIPIAETRMKIYDLTHQAAIWRKKKPMIVIHGEEVPKGLTKDECKNLNYIWAVEAGSVTGVIGMEISELEQAKPVWLTAMCNRNMLFETETDALAMARHLFSDDILS